MENYKPEIIEGTTYVKMIVQGRKCKTCEKTMIRKLGRGELFPEYIRIDQDAQMKAGGLVYLTSTHVDGHPICEECVAAGKATFTCDLCKERRPSSEVKETFGYPADETLCVKCYETVPAKAWDEKVEELNEAHRYDSY